jgi:uncharacterized protein YidB (DUF937 family)/uncharacterized membrane protein YeaQ/YmgE (transglycosylase-associated protein family)
MGLLDIINGMQNSPRGLPSGTATTSGMSPLTMGLLALLAYKAFKPGRALGNVFGGNADNFPQPTSPSPGTTSGGGLGGLLGSLFAGGAAGNLLTGGLGELLKRLQQNGQGDAAKSWVASGPNQSIAPDELARAAGADTLDALVQHSGMPREQVLAELSRSLPGAVDELTPEGRVLPSMRYHGGCDCAGSDHRSAIMGLIWIIVVGFVAGVVARWLAPGPNNPAGFLLTTILGIAGAFVATYIGQSLGWYRADQGAGFISATIGAVVMLFVWNRLVTNRVIGDPGSNPRRL